MSNSAHNNGKQIDFYFDFMSPFAYLARGRIVKIAHQYDCELVYIPIDISQAKKAAGNTGPSNREMPVKLNYLMKDIGRWAAIDKLPVNFPASLDSYRMNLGTFFAIDKNQVETYVANCFDIGWGQGADIGSDETLITVVNAMGWPHDEFFQALESIELKLRYQAANERAQTQGVFGVPTFMIEGEMWWGNDRLHFLETFVANQA